MSLGGTLPMEGKSQVRKRMSPVRTPSTASLGLPAARTASQSSAAKGSNPELHESYRQQALAPPLGPDAELLTRQLESQPEGADEEGSEAGGSTYRALDPGSSLGSAPPVAEILSAFGRRVGLLAKLGSGSLDARAALPPLVAMLRFVPSAEGAQADAAAALAHLMADSESNRATVADAGGVDALISLLGHAEATSDMRNGAVHALHMLVRSPDLCARVAATDGAIPALIGLCAETDTERLEGALPAAGTLCTLADKGGESVRASIRGAGGCDALASLILVSGGEWPAASKFAGYALYSLMTEVCTPCWPCWPTVGPLNTNPQH